MPGAVPESRKTRGGWRTVPDARNRTLSVRSVCGPRLYRLYSAVRCHQRVRMSQMPWEHGFPRRERVVRRRNRRMLCIGTRRQR